MLKSRKINIKHGGCIPLQNWKLLESRLLQIKQVFSSHRLSQYPLTASTRLSSWHPLILLRSPLIHHLSSWYWHREAMFEVNPSIPRAVQLCSLFIPGSLCGDGGLSVWSVAEPGDLWGLWRLVDTIFPQRGPVLAVFWSSCAPVFSMSLSCP